MAQISIPMSNKVGYSMFWNSMWDRKINFSRFLKEDIFLREFIPMIFTDFVSSKILKTKKFSDIKNKDIIFKYNLPIKTSNLTRKDFDKYVFDMCKINIFNSRTWILKYQKWVIIIFFIYSPIFNSFKMKKKKIRRLRLNNFINLNTSYKIINFKLKFSYNYFNNTFDKHYF